MRRSTKDEAAAIRSVRAIEAFRNHHVRALIQSTHADWIGSRKTRNFDKQGFWCLLKTTGWKRA